MKIKAALDEASLQLQKVSDTARLDARVLMKNVLGLSDLELLTRWEEELSEEEERRFRTLWQERQSGKPVAYILGFKEFMGMTFKVTENTLIPRPDSEIVVEEALRLIREKHYETVLDLCCGSGALGLSIARILEFTNVTLSDINKEALKVTGENARNLGVESRVQCVESDLFLHLPQRFDLIISNPPYISAADMEELPRSVKAFEPELALYGGTSGLDFYQSITANAREHLQEGGAVVFEIGYDQRHEVEKMLTNHGFGEIKTIKDLSGKDRAVSAVLLPET